MSSSDSILLNSHDHSILDADDVDDEVDVKKEKLKKINFFTQSINVFWKTTLATHSIMLKFYQRTYNAIMWISSTQSCNY
ncbi:hypothetical protein BpHYR1_011094 [Brachionus plicatilis]|uniref:Uncharacterized protein n=1 Tax=Brachionus plicatilis TaxID=10195 RepID=A0A3M7PRD5_BRAPC|nr:hypothetical protein BpHYR1_011094 [Brachionus plicatilis]